MINKIFEKYVFLQAVKRAARKKKIRGGSVGIQGGGGGGGGGGAGLQKFLFGLKIREGADPPGPSPEKDDFSVSGTGGS